MKKITLFVLGFIEGKKNFEATPKNASSRIISLTFGLILIALRLLQIYKIHHMTCQCKEIATIFIYINHEIDKIIVSIYLVLLLLKSFFGHNHNNKVIFMIIKSTQKFPNLMLLVFIGLIVYANHKLIHFAAIKYFYLAIIDFIIHLAIHFLQREKDDNNWGKCKGFFNHFTFKDQHSKVN